MLNRSHSLRALALGVALSLLQSGLSAQAFGDNGDAKATSSDQQAVLDTVQDLLEAVGGEDFTGIALTNADLNGNLPAAAHSNPDGTGIIGVDFERIDEVIPPGTPGAPGYPGVVVILVFHELQHLNHGWGNSPCQEIELAVYVATVHCELICAVVASGGATDALCLVYDRVKGNVNGSAIQDQATALGCSGNTGPIPDCDCCP